jgi:hypothetical protein
LKYKKTKHGARRRRRRRRSKKEMGIYLKGKKNKREINAKLWQKVRLNKVRNI